MSAARAAVIGGGLSGALQSIHLLREGAERVLLIERGRTPGRGVAYGTDRPEHLLNVPARRMSAFPDDPDHFVRWFEARCGGTAEDFAPRMLYGDYVVELLDQAGDRLEVVRGEAVAIDRGVVILGDGRAIEAESGVLALGNFAPATPSGVDPSALGDRWVADPWSSELAVGLNAGDAVLLLGTGLTAVDAALTLDSTGFSGRIVALSRRGLAPRAHAAREPADSPDQMLQPKALALLRHIRRRSGEVGWRRAVHELRNVTQALWRSAGMAERRRFLRHLRPWWDVHRHKIAPAVAERIAAMEQSGRLSFVAGRMLSTAGDGTVRWRPRGGESIETLNAARIVNCTGPELHVARVGEPLLDSLLGAGSIRPDPCRLGIDVDGECRVLSAGGIASTSLYAIGPITRGAFWESIAVPDIRVQAAAVARRIAA
ncbi:FAD/NAD(P)-binding protein [Allosphingosinicella sp.]|uniref:FAD/NAD(P)-binding protein n=1 Tax=Allosphingosinicella sp. TaxID=2823234 RepID=UPI002EF0CD81